MYTCTNVLQNKIKGVKQSQRLILHENLPQESASHRGNHQFIPTIRHQQQQCLYETKCPQQQGLFKRIGQGHKVSFERSSLYEYAYQIQSLYLIHFTKRSCNNEYTHIKYENSIPSCLKDFGNVTLQGIGDKFKFLLQIERSSIKEQACELRNACYFLFKIL